MFFKIILWLLSRKNQPLPTVFHYEKPSFTDNIEWTILGHSSVLLKLSNLTILFDPIFSKRAGIGPFGPRRLTPLPVTLEELPPIDIICLSHDHYDHLDIKTLHFFKNKNITLIVGPKYKNFFKGFHVIELQPFEEVKIKDTVFKFLPVKHRSGRNLIKMIFNDVTIPGSFLIQHPEKTFYFTGDTAYTPIFKDYAQFNIDIAFIPIGAYEPNFILKNYHINPQEALQIAKDLKSKKNYGIHFETFPLGDEPFHEPRELIEKLSKEEGIDFTAPIFGKVYQ